MTDSTVTPGLERGVADGVATLRLSRAPRNLLLPELMDAMREELLSLDADEAVRAIVLTGEGEFFCGGLDIQEMRTRDGGAAEFATAAVELVRLFPKLGTLAVAAVNGDALALGYALVCSCDLAIGVEGTHLGTVEASAGLWPMVAQVAALQRLNPRQALENVITGRPFEAERAREVGVLNAVVPGDELDGAVSEWVEAGTRAGAALGPGRRSFYRLADLPYDQALDEALEEFKRFFG